MTNNLRNKNQCNYAIAYEPIFHNIFSLSSDPPMDTLPVVNANLRGGKKNRATMNTSLVCLLDSRLTDIVIKRKHTGTYGIRMRSTKVGHSTAAGTHYRIHDVKFPYYVL